MEPVRDIPPPPLPLDWQPRRKFRNRIGIHLFLFLATVGSTWLIGGAAYAATVLLILGAHELGHYFACRYYDVDASLPYFLPFPLSLTGTLGAFIRIREPIATKKMLFDIGIAGPIAGFLVTVPALFLGVAQSQVVPVDAGGELWLGEPLLIQFASRLVWGALPGDHTLLLGGVAFAAWFGMLATALNLFPIGQLDGGHIAYAVLGRRSTYVTLVMIVVALGLSYLSTSWLVWTVLMILMVLAFGPRHPKTFDEDEPLDRGRVALALFAVFMFAVCFTPVPIDLLIGE